MSDTPSWLTEENVAVAGKVAANPVAQQVAVAAAKEKGYLPKDVENQNDQHDTNTPPPGMAPEEFMRMKKFHLFLRIGFICVSIIMATASALKIINTTSPSVVFISCYVFFFAIIICCFEAALKGIARAMSQNFGFMYSLGGKMTFLIFIAILCYSLGWLGIVAMCSLFVLCIFNGYVLLKFPGYEKWLREYHYNLLNEK